MRGNVIYGADVCVTYAGSDIYALPQLGGVIPGPAEGRSPGSIILGRSDQTHVPGVWIPGSPLRGAPE
jgi:hypothetical protein